MLGDLQRKFAASLRDPADGHVLTDMAAVGDDVLPARARFDVYRNNVSVSLCDALEALYPVCTRLVGRDFFRAAARVYLQHAMPGQATLIGFAPDFAGFLVGFEPARGLPYLPDVARLECAWHKTYHAADAVPVTADDLARYLDANGGAALDRLVLGLPPAHQFLMSPYPISRIWAANQPDRDGQVHLIDGAQSERLYVVRPGTQVEVRRVSPGAFALLSAVAGGATLGLAMIAAFEAEPDCDTQQIFAALLTAGSFTWALDEPGATEQETD